MSRIVESTDVRPAGPPDKCFYCGASVGLQHRHECVLVRRKVVVRHHIEVVMDFPVSWGSAEIEFNLNESSRCASSLLDDLARIDVEKGCLCGIVHSEYVREAE